MLTGVKAHALNVVKLLLDAFPCSSAVFPPFCVARCLIAVVPSEAVCEDLVDRALAKLVSGERSYTGQKTEAQ